MNKNFWILRKNFHPAMQVHGKERWRMKGKSIDIPFQQWMHIMRYEYDYAQDEKEFSHNGYANIIGKTFQYAVECRYDFIPFVKAFLASDIFAYFEQMLSIYSQAPYHILAAFDNEMLGKGKRMHHLEEEQTELADVSYWLGYLFMQWKYLDDANGEELASQYDIQWMMEQYEQGTFQKYSIRKAIQATKAKFNFKVLE